MPHYLDGQEARVGDIVRGRPGYSAKNDEIVGVVLSIDSEVNTVNVTVLVPDGYLGVFLSPDYKHGALVTGKVQYGQTDHFERIET